MALAGNVTSTLFGGASSIDQVFLDKVEFVGDAAYVAGGSANFSTYIRSKVARMSGREILEVISGDFVGAGSVLLHARFDKANDKLKLYLASTGVEVADGDYSAITLKLTILSK